MSSQLRPSAPASSNCGRGWAGTGRGLGGVSSATSFALRRRDVWLRPYYAPLCSRISRLRASEIVRRSRKWARARGFLLQSGVCRPGGGHCISLHLRGLRRPGVSGPRGNDDPGPVGAGVFGMEHDIPSCAVREPGGGCERRGPVQPRAAPAGPRQDPLCR